MVHVRLARRNPAQGPQSLRLALISRLMPAFLQFLRPDDFRSAVFESRLFGGARTLVPPDARLVLQTVWYHQAVLTIGELLGGSRCAKIAPCFLLLKGCAADQPDHTESEW